MSEEWRIQFANKINQCLIQDRWDLSVDPNLVKENKGLIYITQTFGSFRCSKCLRSWNSSKVRVLFLLNLNKRQKHGTVKMRIFKQACESCKRPEEHPTITSENVSRVVSNLVNKILKKFYEVKDEIQEIPSKIYGPLEGPHNKDRCEACRFGICEQQMSSGVHEGQGGSGAWTAVGVAVGIGALALMLLSNK